MRVDRIPAALRDLKRWVLWRYIERDGKRTKAPCQPSGRPAKSNSPVTWTHLDVALEALQRGGFDGLGFVLGDGITGVDLDWKGYAGEGVPAEAQAVVDRLNSYTEWSPSRKGCHILLRGALPAGARNRHHLPPGVELEVYSHGRFFTVTAEPWAGYPLDLEERQAELEALLRDLAPPAPEPERKPTPSAPVDLPDADLLERMFASKHGAEIRRLWDGDITGYPSHSEADLALAGHLMWWANNDQTRADRLFRQSGLYREKWNERHFSDGKTYGEATLERARAAGGYTPGPVAHGRLAGGHPHLLEGRTGGGLVLGQPRYKVEGGRILAARLEGRGEHQSVSYYPLSNFACVISREVVSTDGLETETLFELRGYAATGAPLPVALVRASEFAGMNWVQRCWGAGAIVTPGQGAKDHLRAAIQYLSLEAGSLERATVYRHLGWARLGDTWVYLHTKGGIGAEGAVGGLEVSPGRVLEHFALPEPPTGEGERAAITALWRLLEVAPHRVTVPLLLYALAAPLGHSPFSLYLAGPSGARKTRDC